MALPCPISRNLLPHNISENLEWLKMYTKEYKLSPPISEKHSQKLLLLIEDELQRHRPSAVNISQEELKFNAGMLRLVGNWNMLTSITSGTVSVNSETSSLRFSLSFTELVIFSIIGTLFLGFNMRPTSASITTDLIFIVFVIWLFGLNYLIAIRRFQGLLKKCVRQSPYEII